MLIQIYITSILYKYNKSVKFKKKKFKYLYTFKFKLVIQYTASLVSYNNSFIPPRNKIEWS